MELEYHINKEKLRQILSINDRIVLERLFNKDSTYFVAIRIGIEHLNDLAEDCAAAARLKRFVDMYLPAGIDHFYVEF